jgi:hypothetical protein
VQSVARQSGAFTYGHMLSDADCGNTLCIEAAVLNRSQIFCSVVTMVGIYTVPNIVLNNVKKFTHLPLPSPHAGCGNFGPSRLK